MNVLDLLQRTRETLKSLRRNRNNVRALAHLDAHLLKDIGLRVEHGIVRPLYPDAGVTDEPVSAPLDDAPERSVSAAGAEKCCPHCGTSLA